MRSLFLAFTVGAVAILAGCASDKPAPPPGAGMMGAFYFRNDSTSTLTVQPFEAETPGGMRKPLGDAFTIAPGDTDSRNIGVPGKVVVLTIKASGQDRKYLSGEWVVTERAGGFRLYAFTDHADTVRLSWNDRGGEEVLLQ
ncbi:MAG: hypothetical protein KF805_05815 [Phycisphaeraceae bacterium]|nr:hypothetical protein [Phycisphaeraceae bacterium]